METIRKRAVACARGYIGTRFHHQGRCRQTATHRGGIDCLGLLVGVAEDLGLQKPDGTPLAALDRADYGHVPDGSELIAALMAHLEPLPLAGAEPGDILLFALDGSPRHLAIMGETGGRSTLIHAYAQARCVVEQPLDAWWKVRLTHAFRIPSLTCIET